MADIINTALTSLERISNPENAGKALLGINVFATALAAATNTFAVASDKNTSSDDKKFLVPAGIATGVANIGLYLALTLRVIKSLGKKTDAIIQNMEQAGTLASNALEYAAKNIEKAGKGLFKKAPEYIDDMKTYLIKDGAATPEAISEYKSSLKGCSSVLGAFIGVVVGYGILSPIIRDVSAYFVQKHMEKKNPEMKEIPYKPYFDPSHVKVGYAHTKQPLNMNNYMAFTRGTPMGSSLTV